MSTEGGALGGGGDDVGMGWWMLDLPSVAGHDDREQRQERIEPTQGKRYRCCRRRLRLFLLNGLRSGDIVLVNAIGSVRVGHEFVL